MASTELTYTGFSRPDQAPLTSSKYDQLACDTLRSIGLTDSRRTMHQVIRGIVTGVRVSFAGCAATHNPSEEAARLQQLDEATGHPLAHMPGLPVSDEASDSCIAAFEAAKGAADGPDLMDETLETCGDVPEWAYALMTVGGLAAKAGERPLVTSLEVACYEKTLAVCRDGQELGLF